MVYLPIELVRQVTSALVRAGFPVLGDGEADRPGLRVVEIPAGAVVRWTASDGFTSLARDQGGRPAGEDRLQVMVQAAVTGVLVELGHTVAVAPDGADLLVRSEAA
ncbi:hypothetical protein [Streptomyces sp. NPDC058812]|uniref:hypothetical protein n=1 Tax=unclassified Streptomyces TaxID=2593676 RepID=UPI00368BB29C